MSRLKDIRLSASWIGVGVTAPDGKPAQVWGSTSAEDPGSGGLWDSKVWLWRDGALLDPIPFAEARELEVIASKWDVLRVEPEIAHGHTWVASEGDDIGHCALCGLSRDSVSGPVECMERAR